MKKVLSIFIFMLVLIGCSNEEINNEKITKKEENIDIIEPKKNMYVKIEGGIIYVNSNYNDEIDIIVSLGKEGKNNIFNIYNIEKVPSIGDMPNNDFTNKELFYMDIGITDWFGPYRVRALNNIDGKENSDFTGGNHDYLNGSGGTPTGRTSEITFKVNNFNVSEYDGYAEKIDVYWTNYVQGSNTKKEDGSGREILKEDYYISYNGDNVWKVECSITFLEDVEVVRYYGLQSIINNWNEYIMFGNDDNWIKMSTIQSPRKNEDSITIRRENDYLKMTIDNTYSLGKREYLSDNYGAFIVNYGGGGKTYFNLINNAKFNAGVKVGYKGTYEFIYTK